MGRFAQHVGVPTDRSIVRRACLDDVPRIVAIYAMDDLIGSREIAAGEDLGRCRAAFAVIDQHPSQLLLVAELDGQVVGTLQVTCIQHLISRAFRRAVVEALFVDRACRGRGIGAQLVAAAEDWAQTQGCGALELTSNKRRVEAHRFYQRLGFTASHEGFKKTIGAARVLAREMGERMASARSLGSPRREN